MTNTPSLQDVVGEMVSHPWFSDYSICYLELGALKAGKQYANGRVGNPSGQFSIFLGDDWEAEYSGQHRSRRQLHVSSDEEYEAFVASIRGAVIQAVAVVEGSFELEIRLSTGVVLRTISKFPHEPEWDVRFDNQVRGHLFFSDGELTFFERTSDR
ncbi:MAG: hypothetical protein ACRC02_11665 [Vogesella sp.]|uniref:hypothetical protein n=1 Tax=Vogesella sp. TaxID=1904252 RepID=UPI003F33E6DA